MKKFGSAFSRAHKLERMIAFGKLHGESDGNGGGGGGGEKDTYTKEELAAEVTKQVQARLEAETSGLKTKNKELLEKNSSLSALAKKLEGIDVDGLIDFKSKIDNDEILKLASEGKHSEAIEKATEKLRVTHGAEVTSLNEKLTSMTTERDNLKTNLSRLLVDGAATNAFIGEKGSETAIEDIVLRARNTFTVDESGDVIARDKDGKIIQGAEGPLTVKEWIVGLKKTAPHLFPESSGGGAQGGRGGDSDEAGMLAAAAKGPKALREWKEKNKKK